MYKKGEFVNLSELEILKQIKDKGFNPTKFRDSRGYIYKPHKHLETKLLVFLEGNMVVQVENKKYKCSAGDEVIIPGGALHSAKVGKMGCSFFWAEKLV